jgi:predicted MFS family arabinose efflux permease
MHLEERGLGYVFLGWGILLAITSVYMAPRLQRKMGTIKSMCLMLILFAMTLIAMGIWTSTKEVIIVSVVLAGAFLGNNNTLITTAVMQAAPIERATASASYSFLRFLGGAAAPFFAGKLAEWYNPHVPFYVGGVFVLVSVGFILINRKHLKHIDKAGSAH